jgi:hypothetical protein
MKGSLYPKVLETTGHEYGDHYIEVWRAMNIFIESGELRSGHLRALKPY